MASLIRLKQLESSSALYDATAAGADFSQSVIGVMTGNVVGILPENVISSSAQLNGTVIKNLTISTTNADNYSLIISGAAAVVDATERARNLPDVDWQVKLTVLVRVPTVQVTVWAPDLKQATRMNAWPLEFVKPLS